jgi:hypothetical protein
MDLKRLTDRAKQIIDKRGGTESAKQDAEELRDIATGSGSLTEKAKEAVEAVKEPGAAETARQAPPPDGERGRDPAAGGDRKRAQGARGGGGRRS